MELRVIVIPGSRFPGIEELSDGRLRIRVRAKAKDGRANEEVRELLAARYSTRVEHVFIIRGKSAPRKVVQIRGFRMSQNLN